MVHHSDWLPMWVVYDHPSDYPNCYVARLFSGEKPTASVMICANLDVLQNELINMGLVKLMPMPGDDPVILETWL